MDLSSLEIFEAVADTGSVTRAARQLGRAPSNITTRVQQLEADLGVALYARSGSRMELTAEGKTFRTYASRMRALARQAREAVNPAKPDGPLRLGSMESTAASRLPHALSAFKDISRSVSVTLTLGASADLVDQVRRGMLDCALVAVPPKAFEHIALPSLDGLDPVPVFLERLLLLHPADEGERDTAPAELAVMEPGCTYRRIAEAWLQGRTGTRMVEVSSYHTMLARIVAGQAAGIMPESVFRMLQWPRLPKQTVIADVETVLISAETDGPTASMQRFKSLLQEIGISEKVRIPSRYF